MPQIDIRNFMVSFHKQGQVNIICSEFFAHFEDALSFAKGVSGPYLIFRKHLVKQDQVCWELMPYGASGDYKFSLQIMEYKWYIIVFAILVIYAIIKMKPSSGSALTT